MNGTHFQIELLLLFLGVLLLSCGCSALNQVQEYQTDSQLTRTKNRVIPKEILTSKTALFISIFLICLGLICLYIFKNNYIFGLGLFSIIWYNGIYTNLKKVSAFAIAIGAVVGTIPPLIGWIGAGGGWNIEIIIVCLIFFHWQIPHFWLILKNEKEDYQKFILPNLYHIFYDKQVSKLISIWTLTLAVETLFVPFFQIVNLSLIKILFIVQFVWLVGIGIGFLFLWQKELFLKIAVIQGNLFIIVFMLLIMVDKLVLIYS